MQNPVPMIWTRGADTLTHRDNNGRAACGARIGRHTTRRALPLDGVQASLRCARCFPSQA